MKKFLYLLASMTIVIALASCGGRSSESSSSYYGSTASNSEYSSGTGSSNSSSQSEGREEEMAFLSKTCGTYEFSDGFNTWELTVNPDETVTARNKSKGGNSVAYGFWNDYTSIGKGCAIEFHDAAPMVWFNGDGGYSTLSYFSIDVDNMWIYKDTDTYKAKNPDKRLKLTKTKETQSVVTNSQTELDPSKTCGTYEFSDGFNTWELTINPDETATARNKSKGGNSVAYGCWNDYTSIGKGCAIEFKDAVPMVWFEGDDGYSNLSYFSIDVENMWIYKNPNEYKAKNPNKRLKLTKTK